MIISCCVGHIIWALWKECNNRKFKFKSSPLEVLANQIVNQVFIWLLNKKEFKIFSASNFRGNWLSIAMMSHLARPPTMAIWTPPPPGCFKLNFDGSALGCPGPAGFGGVLHNENSDLLFSYAGPLGRSDSTTAELACLLHGLKVFSTHLLGTLYIEGDSAVIINWCANHGHPPWRHWDMFKEICNLLSGINCLWKKVPRSANHLADAKAKAGVSLQHFVVEPGPSLGSLVVRLVFLPFEESSYCTFARFSSGQSLQRKTRLESSLIEALKLVILIGLVVAAFGPSYSYCLIRLLYGGKWSDGEAPNVLRYYCLYVIVLAMNGTSEAFLHAAANEKELKLANIFLLVSSAIYIILNVSLIRSAGAVGLIAANSLNMILRIIYSAIFINNYFQDCPSFSFRRCLPSGWWVLFLSGAATLISERVFLDRGDAFWLTFMVHLSIGLTCFSISFIIIYRYEKSFIKKIIRFQDHAD